MSKIDIFNLLAAIWLAPRVSPWLGTAISLSYVVVSSALLFGWWK